MTDDHMESAAWFALSAAAFLLAVVIAGLWRRLRRLEGTPPEVAPGAVYLSFQPSHGWAVPASDPGGVAQPRRVCFSSPDPPEPAGVIVTYRPADGPRLAETRSFVLLCDVDGEVGIVEGGHYNRSYRAALAELETGESADA
jgi:hypothetical protein